MTLARLPILIPAVSRLLIAAESKNTSNACLKNDSLAAFRVSARPAGGFACGGCSARVSNMATKEEGFEQGSPCGYSPSARQRSPATGGSGGPAILADQRTACLSLPFRGAS